MAQAPAGVTSGGSNATAQARARLALRDGDQDAALTIRIGRDDPRSRAMFCLDSPGQMPLLLDRMLALKAPPAAATPTSG